MRYNLFRGVAIIMAINGALGLVFFFWTLMGGGGLTVTILISLAGSVIELVAGLLSAKNWEKPTMAPLYIVMGVIIIVLNLVGAIITFAAGSVAIGTLLSMLAGLVLPILYLVGAFQLKGQAQG